MKIKLQIISFIGVGRGGSKCYVLERLRNRSGINLPVNPFPFCVLVGVIYIYVYIYIYIYIYIHARSTKKQKLLCTFIFIFSAVFVNSLSTNVLSVIQKKKKKKRVIAEHLCCGNTLPLIKQEKLIRSFVKIRPIER